MHKARWTPAAGAAIGAVFLGWISGWRTLNPTEIGWLMRYDWPIHFLGWHLFRHEPWHWPPGALHGYYAPIGTAIGFTDSIPLVAFALKPFQALLPATFQYIGLYLFTCFVLQGLFGVLLMRLWTPRPALQLLGASLFVLMPTLLIRVGHPALCSHWLLLWALLVAMRRAAPRVHEWAAIGLLAGLLHPYLAVMTLAVLGGVVAGSDPWARARTAAAGALTVVATLTGWWLSGLFLVSGAETLATEGLGYYSMNLLAPITPTGWSTLLPEWSRATAGQDFEGFQYLGAGVLLLALVTPPLLMRARRSLPWRAMLPVVATALVMAIYALSPRITFGSLVLADFTGPFSEKLAVFRATGRFFWPMAYLLLASMLALAVTRLPARASAALLALVVALQVVDLRRAHMERHDTARTPAFFAWNQPMQSAAWAAALPHYRDLVLYPPPQCGRAPVPYEPAAYMAGLHGLTVNAGDVARPDLEARRAYCHNLGDTMRTGEVADTAFYIMTSSEVAALKAAAKRPVVCGAIDGLSVCVTAASYQTWRDAAELQ